MWFPSLQLSIIPLLCVCDVYQQNLLTIHQRDKEINGSSSILTIQAWFKGLSSLSRITVVRECYVCDKKQQCEHVILQKCSKEFGMIQNCTGIVFIAFPSWLLSHLTELQFFVKVQVGWSVFSIIGSPQWKSIDSPHSIQHVFAPHSSVGDIDRREN